MKYSEVKHVMIFTLPDSLDEEKKAEFFQKLLEAAISFEEESDEHNLFSFQLEDNVDMVNIFKASIDVSELTVKMDKKLAPRKSNRTSKAEYLARGQ